MFKKLGSVKITIVLLVLLVVSSIIGTLVPQGFTNNQYQAKYGDDLYSFMKNLQLLDVYHSYWYTALLFIFCIHLIICSTLNLKPLINILTRTNHITDSTELNNKKVYQEISLRSNNKQGKSNDVSQQVKDIFKRSFYKLKQFDESKGIYYFEKGKIGRIGPLITHASIVIILIGGILVSRLGFRDYMNIPIGKTMDVPHTSFQIRADYFKAEFYPNSQTPKEYTSKLTIIENNVEKITKSIEVNHPLQYKGMSFYQSSHGDIVEVELSKKSPEKPEGEFLGNFSIAAGQEEQVPNSQIRIKVTHYVPDFVMDDSGNVGTRSDEPKNPAAFLELYDGDELKQKSWIFQKFPDFHGAGDSEYSMKFTSSGYYTGLQVSKSPFLSIVWFGFLFMVVGMFLSFYMQYKQIWLRVSPDKVEIGASSYKNRAGFDRELERVNALFK